MQAPLPHPEQVNTTHVGQACSQATEAGEQRAQVFLGSFHDDVDREVASGRRRGSLRGSRVTLGQVGKHRCEGLQDSGVVAHGSIDAREDQGNESTTRVDAPRRLIRRLHEPDLRLGRKARKHILDLGERIAHLVKLANGTAEHFNEGVRPLDRRGNGRQGCRQHAARHERSHPVLVPEGTSPRFKQRTERKAAVPKASTDDRLNTGLKCHAQVGTGFEGVHRRGEGSHRGRSVRPRITVGAIPSIQVIQERRKPRRFLGTGAARLDNDRSIKLHDSPFLPRPIVPATIAVCDLTRPITRATC